MPVATYVTSNTQYEINCNPFLIMVEMQHMSKQEHLCSICKGLIYTRGIGMEFNSRFVCSSCMNRLLFLLSTRYDDLSRKSEIAPMAFESLN